MNNTPILLFFLAIVIVAAGLLVLMSLKKRPTHHLNRDAYRGKWLELTTNISNDPASLQMAILNADKLLDLALRQRGISGNTLGERLKAARTMLTDNNGTWNAHKLRNQIAHDDHVELSRGRVNSALEAFRKALVDIGAL